VFVVPNLAATWWLLGLLLLLLVELPLLLLDLLLRLLCGLFGLVKETHVFLSSSKPFG